MSDTCNCIDIKVKVMMDEPEINGEVDVSEVILCSDGEDYKRGYEEGHAQGLVDGRSDGYKNGYDEGHKAGSESGYTQGKQEGLTEGYDKGYTQGKTDGYQAGYDEGYSKGYSEGYEKGKTESGGEEFIGIKYSDFTTMGGGAYPTVADARSFETLMNGVNVKRSIMSYAFYNPSIYFSDSFFLYLQEVYLPEGITALTNTFCFCRELTTIHGDLSEVTMLNGAFRGCSALTEIPYMPNLDVIQANSFNGCTGLTSVNLYKKPTTLATTAFTGCTNLRDLYVSFSEGEVAGAPWGAANATIHYNTQFDENHNPIILEV